MTTRISDLHIAREDALPSPESLHQALPCAEPQAAFIARSREAVRRILRGEDDRLLVIVGPCSIHDPQAAAEYATRLRDAAKQRQDTLLPVMRVYFEKPRTRMGWKGLIYDPDLDGAGDIAKGLRAARGLLLECAAQEVPAASEILDLVTPQYYAELLTWGGYLALVVVGFIGAGMPTAGLSFGLGLLTACLLAAALTGALAWGVDRLVFQRLRRSGAHHLTLVFASFGIGLMMRHVIVLFWGHDSRFYTKELQIALEVLPP